MTNEQNVIVRADGVRFLVLPDGSLVEEGTEHFNNVGPCPTCSDFEIERDARTYPQHVGKLWLGSTWFTVAEARVVRDWLNEVIPALREVSDGK